MRSHRSIPDGPASSVRVTEVGKAMLAFIVCLAAGAALVIGFISVAC